MAREGEVEWARSPGVSRRRYKGNGATADSSHPKRSLPALFPAAARATLNRATHLLTPLNELKLFS